MAWSAPVPHPDPLGTRLQFSPNICQHQNKSGHGTLDGEGPVAGFARSEEHTSELQSPCNRVYRLLLEKNYRFHTKRAPSGSLVVLRASFRPLVILSICLSSMLA